MARLRQSLVADAAADRTFLVFLVAVAASLIRAADQPGIDLGAGSASITIVPTDVVIAVLAVALAARIVRVGRYPRAAVALTAAAGVLAALVLVTGAANSSSALVSAGKLVELGALLVGAVVLVDSVERLWAVVAVLVAMTTVATAWALVDWAQDPGSRQGSYLGEHDFAALSTVSLVVGLASLHTRPGSRRLPLIAGIVGALGITLGAALASLLGLYLAGAALIAVAAARGALRLRPVVATVLIALAVTGGTYGLRGSDLGFLHQWFAPAEDAQPGQYAGSWSQRLMFTYIGGRVFLDNPVLGTGWWGELPPSEYARFLPDARARFPDQPDNYFPPADGTFVPQQTYDQVLYELGLVGVFAFLALAVIAVRDACRAARGWRREATGEIAAYLPSAWLASLAGALAGAALFGGIPMTALFWLTLGLVGAAAVLAVAPGAVEPAAPDEAASA